MLEQRFIRHSGQVARVFFILAVYLSYFKIIPDLCGWVGWEKLLGRINDDAYELNAFSNASHLSLK
ncbi:hypothetical protein [Chryseobacterium luteum]|nr:hypothetical protein [Chryseobacterium luteum]